MRNFIFACLSSIFLIACGGDSTSVVQDTPPEPEPQAENMLMGSVIKGPVGGAVVIVYEFDGSTEIARGETDASGNFSISKRRPRQLCLKAWRVLWVI